MKKEKLSNKPIIVESFREPLGEFEAGNPFLLNLEPLPLDDIESQDKSKDIFKDEDGFTDEERKMSKSVRSILLSRIMNNFFVPIPWHVELSKKVDRLLFAAYDRIDPFDEKRRNKRSTNLSNHDFEALAEDFEINTQNRIKGIDTTALGYSLIGFSGAGKTSALDLKLRPLRQVYEIHSFNGEEFCAYQMPVLLVKCPDSGSIKDLVDAIFREVYERTSLEPFNIKVKASKENIDDYVEKIAKILTFLNVGLICIDDADNIAAMTKNKERLKRFLSHLMNSVDTSFLFAGTEELYPILAQEYSRRRMSSGKVIKAEYFSKNDPKRMIFSKSVWKKLNILQTENEYTEEIDDIMYTATLGSPAGFKLLYTDIQEAALQTKDEKITIKMVDECAREYMSLRKEDRKKILTRTLESYDPESNTKLLDTVSSEALMREAQRLGYSIPDKELKKICSNLADRFPSGNWSDAKDLLIMTLNKSVQKGVQNA